MTFILKELVVHFVNNHRWLVGQVSAKDGGLASVVFSMGHSPTNQRPIHSCWVTSSCWQFCWLDLAAWETYVPEVGPKCRRAPIYRRPDCNLELWNDQIWTLELMHRYCEMCLVTVGPFKTNNMVYKCWETWLFRKHWVFQRKEFDQAKALNYIYT